MRSIQANINGIMKSNSRRSYLLLSLSSRDVVKIVENQKKTKQNVVRLYL